MLDFMMRILNLCPHRHQTFPMSPLRKPWIKYVVCLDCGRSWEYDWETMTRGAEICPENAKKELDSAGPEALPFKA